MSEMKLSATQERNLQRVRNLITVFNLRESVYKRYPIKVSKNRDKIIMKTIHKAKLYEIYVLESFFGGIINGLKGARFGTRSLAFNQHRQTCKNTHIKNGRITQARKNFKEFFQNYVNSRRTV